MTEDLRKESVEAMWRAYLATQGETPETTAKFWESWHFCDNEKDANELVLLVRQGQKRGTASLLWSYEHEGERLPCVGDHVVITDWSGEAQCVIRITDIAVVPFQDVSAEFARTEGEGDCSLAHWRRVHWECFTRYMHEIGREPEEEMPVICQTFEVVYGGL
jgi:uncharacterized protein YhfF